MITSHPVRAVHLFDMASPGVKYCVGRKCTEDNVIILEYKRQICFQKPHVEVYLVINIVLNKI